MSSFVFFDCVGVVTNRTAVILILAVVILGPVPRIYSLGVFAPMSPPCHPRSRQILGTSPRMTG